MGTLQAVSLGCDGQVAVLQAVEALFDLLILVHQRGLGCQASQLVCGFGLLEGREGLRRPCHLVSDLMDYGRVVVGVADLQEHVRVCDD